ncbi:MAG: leucine-rich repeat domain-containing protein [Bacteroidales bacterium]|nr:leucine-rich repeat domain-containing protein [Bacteroidales bacterium]
MKKGFLALAISAGLMHCAFQDAYAQNYDTLSANDLSEYLKDKKGEITVVIDDMGYGYKEVPDFDGKLNLIFAEGVEEIEMMSSDYGNSAKENHSLQSITLPKSVRRIEGFKNCRGLKEVNFDKKYLYVWNEMVDSVGADENIYNIFYGPDEVPEDATSENTLLMKLGTFVGCPLQKSNLVSEGEISGHKFFNFDQNTKHIVVPSKLTNILSRTVTIENMEALETLTFEAAPDSSTIGVYWHENYDDSTEIAEIYPVRVAGNCPNLRKIVLPENTLYFGGATDLPKLESINFPDCLKYLVSLENCPSIKELKLPDALNNAMNNCAPILRSNKSLETVKVFSGLKLGSHLFEEEWWYTEDGITSYNGTFSSCENLKTIEIPEGVTYIGDDCFMNCLSLENVKLPNSLRHIGNHAFANCKSLKTIILPDSLERIGNYAFEGCSNLESIRIPASVKDDAIGKGAFWACEKLKNGNVADPETIIVDGRKLEYWGSDIVVNLKNGIPQDYFKGYHSLKSVIIANKKMMQKGAFGNCVNLESVIAPKGLLIDTTTTEDYEYNSQFRNCPSLKSISYNLMTEREISYHCDEYFCYDDKMMDYETIFDKVDTLTFEDLEGNIVEHFMKSSNYIENRQAKFYVKEKFLKEYQKLMEETNEIINSPKLEYSFGKGTPLEYKFISIEAYNAKLASEWTKGETVVIPEGVKYVPQDIFANNSNIKKVVLPKSMRVISENAFANCMNLTEIEGGENLAAIYDSAFAGSKKLQKFNLPANTVIGQNAFKKTKIKR